MKIYWQVTNGSDGSYGVEFFDSYECIEKLTSDEAGLYEHYPSESDGSFEMKIDPQHQFAETFTGLKVMNMADVKQIMKDYDWDAEEPN